MDADLRPNPAHPRKKRPLIAPSEQNRPMDETFHQTGAQETICFFATPVYLDGADYPRRRPVTQTGTTPLSVPLPHYAMRVRSLSSNDERRVSQQARADRGRCRALLAATHEAGTTGWSPQHREYPLRS